MKRAGEGNRTLVFSLEGYCSTVELHPRYVSPFEDAKYGVPVNGIALNLFLCKHPLVMKMGSAGFEPAKALPSDLQSDPFDRSGNSPSHVFIK